MLVCWYGMAEGSLEVKPPTIWTVGKQRWEESERRRKEVRRSERRKREKKEEAGARKGRKVAIHSVFQWFVALGGRKEGMLKRRVRSQLARWEMKNCTPLWREAHFEAKMHKTPQLRSTFRSCDVAKVHAVVVRSTFPSQNVQSTPFSDHFEMSKKCTPLWHEAHFQVKT